MLTLNLAELYKRGLASFESLSPLERDVFAVHDANLRFEMEGSLAHFVTGSHCAPVSTWLTETLQRVGDKESSRLLSSIGSSDKVARAQLDQLSQQFYHRMEQRWKLVDTYLASQGARLDA